MVQVNEKDWKLFRKKLPEWQEKYMDRLCNEYIKILTSKKNASDRFWEIEKRIKSDKKDTGVVADVRRSQMYDNLTALIIENAITIDDLQGFSEETIEIVKRWARITD